MARQRLPEVLHMDVAIARCELDPLRQGVAWNDGEPFTADDIVFTVETHQKFDGFNAHTFFVDNVASVTAVDDHTVEFKLKQANSRFHTTFLDRWGRGASLVTSVHGARERERERAEQPRREGARCLDLELSTRRCGSSSRERAAFERSGSTPQGILRSSRSRSRATFDHAPSPTALRPFFGLKL